MAWLVGMHLHNIDRYYSFIPTGFCRCSCRLNFFLFLFFLEQRNWQFEEFVWHVALPCRELSSA